MKQTTEMQRCWLTDVKEGVHSLPRLCTTRAAIIAMLVYVLFCAHPACSGRHRQNNKTKTNVTRDVKEKRERQRLKTKQVSREIKYKMEISENENPQKETREERDPMAAFMPAKKRTKQKGIDH
jgi:C4-dicarboxylate-specific signal transduction histidine kinase